MPSEPIEDPTAPEIVDLIADMKATMQANHGAGLAAPQIGVFKRLVIFGGNKSERYPDSEEVPFTILMNPQIEALSDEVTESWEGCLSIPGMRGLVPRYNRIRYNGINECAEPIEREVVGFHAIVVQHECDHLDGILYPMRMDDMAMFGYEDELSQPADDLTQDMLDNMQE